MEVRYPINSPSLIMMALLAVGVGSHQGTKRLQCKKKKNTEKVGSCSHPTIHINTELHPGSINSLSTYCRTGRYSYFSVYVGVTQLCAMCTVIVVRNLRVEILVACAAYVLWRLRGAVLLSCLSRGCFFVVATRLVA